MQIVVSLKLEWKQKQTGRYVFGSNSWISFHWCSVKILGWLIIGHIYVSNLLQGFTKWRSNQDEVNLFVGYRERVKVDGLELLSWNLNLDFVYNCLTFFMFRPRDVVQFLMANLISCGNHVYLVMVYLFDLWIIYCWKVSWMVVC